jgi:hypothetical protein
MSSHTPMAARFRRSKWASRRSHREVEGEKGVAKSTGRLQDERCVPAQLARIERADVAPVEAHAPLVGSARRLFRMASMIRRAIRKSFSSDPSGSALC